MEFNEVFPVTVKLFDIVVSVSLIVILSALLVNNLMFADSFAIIEKSCIPLCISLVARAVSLIIINP